MSLQVLRQLKEQNASIRKQAEINAASLVEFENMYYEVMNVKDEVKHIVAEVRQIKDDVNKVNEEIDNKVFITEAMADTLKELIRKKSTFVAKEVYGYNLDWNGLSKAIGKVRPKFWALLKQHCDDARKYTTIKYKDYEKAVSFIESLSTQDFINYCGKYGIPPLI